MFNACNSQSALNNSKLMRRAITWFCDVSDDMGLHSVSGFYAVLQHTSTRVTKASDGDVNFPK